MSVGIFDQIRAALEGTRELLSDPERWTRSGHARDSAGWPVAFDDPSAVAWSLRGAVMRETKRLALHPFSLLTCEMAEFLDELAAVVGHTSAHDMSLRASHEEIVALLNNAIATCEELRDLGSDDGKDEQPTRR